MYFSKLIFSLSFPNYKKHFYFEIENISFQE